PPICPYRDGELLPAARRAARGSPPDRRNQEAGMLTKGDDFPIHQTPEPIAYAGSDRNFYDRYFFNAYAPDGSAFAAIAFGVYPAPHVLAAPQCRRRPRRHRQGRPREVPARLAHPGPGAHGPGGGPDPDRRA